ncbi:hypothetical protein EV196_10185 [Mariniflexile fucanivorans]|uniref:Outer membrane protein with beta-barrel domain n=1 Tax=Mariniflexile fucanivorans TaxID=264023 RepID=A0A4R1RQI8_9FLAO|nr:hypothetical protein [Mariniflexile fucanivorans]TCL68668.1 hypothetical protein EV196_10185 [Mariniflexile fucanivorans]
MSSKIYGYFFIATTILLLFSNITNAQPKKGEFIQGSIGLGMSAPYEEYNIMGTGFYAQAEYVYAFKKWLGVRPYAGFISTTPSESGTDTNLSEYRVTSKAFLLGGKARICAPIPWVAPYFELGIGLSAGSFETYTPTDNIKENGVLMHIPVTLGLALGKDNGVEVAFTYYYHPTINQFSGAAAIGLSFPINR